MPQFAYLETERTSPERRGSRRKRLWLSANAERGSGERTQVVVHDISQTGLLLESSLPLIQGEQLLLVTQEQAIGRLRVVWTGGRFFGCQFTAPVPNTEGSRSTQGMGALPVKGSPEALALAAFQLQELSRALDHIARVLDQALDGLNRQER